MCTENVKFVVKALKNQEVVKAKEKEKKEPWYRRIYRCFGVWLKQLGLYL
jgi:hypothetical protein